MILIDAAVATRLNLCRQKLPKPAKVGLAITNVSEACSNTILHEWVKLKPHNGDGLWTSRTVRAIVAPDLCTDVLLGIPFFTMKKLVMDFDTGTCTKKETGFDLLHPVPGNVESAPKIPLQQKHRELLKEVAKSHNAVMKELKAGNALHCNAIENRGEKVRTRDVIGAVRNRIEQLGQQEKPQDLGKRIYTEFIDVFEDLPHVEKLSNEIHCEIKLKDAQKMISMADTNQTASQCRADSSILLTTRIASLYYP
jgi:hypothetical protein